MKKTAMIAAFAALMMTASAAFAADEAPKTSGYNFGIVDMTKILRDTDAAKGVIKQFEDKRAAYQAQVTKGEDALRATNANLVKEKDKLSKEALAEKGKAFEQDVRKWKNDSVKHNRILEVAMAGAMTELRRSAAEVIAGIAKQRGYSAVFTQDAAILSTPDLDLTPQVIDQMNKQVKSVPIDWASAEKLVAADAPKK